jgi:hypothetical protein
VEEIEVVVMPKDRIFPASDTQFFSDIDVRVIPESSQVQLSWESADTVISKLVFLQQGQKKTLIIEDGIDELLLDISYFEQFRAEESMTMTLYQALSNNGTFEQQTTNWKRSTTKTFQLVEGFRDTESTNISVYSFPRFPGSLEPIVLEGEFSSSAVSLPDHAYVMTPSGTVKQVLLEKRGMDAFRLRMVPEEWGTHVLELVSTKGEVLFNRALYISEQYVLPIIPWEEVSVASESVGNIRHWINALRAEQNASPVFADGDLNAFAKRYAEQMMLENFISHTTPTGMTLEMRLKQADFQGDYGENLSFGTNLNIALTGLETSASHRRNMLLQKWTKVGIGFAKNEKGEIYVVQVFGK